MSLLQNVLVRIAKPTSQNYLLTFRGYNEKLIIKKHISSFIRNVSLNVSPFGNNRLMLLALQALQSRDRAGVGFQELTSSLFTSQHRALKLKRIHSI